MSAPILTDHAGRPFRRPTKPSQNAPIEMKIAYIRAAAAYADAVTDCANQAFAEAFHKGVS